ncbi:hypothetical protein [Lysobacter koreensis]|uniref:hypothetical protein n=1 Tax=Lysobacter koreensis TaxID=266122 RepID=UPI0036DA1BAB
MDWEISQPLTLAEARDKELIGADGAWAMFKGGVLPTDEVRHVRHNAGIGYALFRGGALKDMVLVTVF